MFRHNRYFTEAVNDPGTVNDDEAENGAGDDEDTEVEGDENGEEHETGT